MASQTQPPTFGFFPTEFPTFEFFPTEFPTEFPTSQPTGICDFPLPNPNLVFAGSEIFQESEVLEYTLDVLNFDEYPEGMFLEAPELSECGVIVNASRTWTELRNGDTYEIIFLFCYPEPLESLFFVAKPGDVKSVYAVYIDRLCDKDYRSNTVDIPQ